VKRDLRYETIHIETDDDVAVVKDRLEWAKSSCVLLVVPTQNMALRRLVNLKLLARHAATSGLQIALISGDPRLVERSREAGIKTFGSVWAAEHSRWLKRSLREGKRVGEGQEGTVDAPIVEAPRVTRKRANDAGERPERVIKDVPRPRRMPFFRREEKRGEPPVWLNVIVRVLRVMGALVVLVGVAAMLAVVLLLGYPSASVELSPMRRPVSAELKVRGNPAVEKVDYASLDIPARSVQVDLRDELRVVPSSVSDMPTEKAQGIVTFINRSTQAISVPISTTVSTSMGANVRFITTLTASVEGRFNALSGPIPVIAVDPGPVGNVAPGQINRINDPVVARQVSVINEQPTSGGAVAPTGVVSQEDKERLFSMMLQQMYQSGYQRLLGEKGEQEFLPPESIIVLPLDYAYDPSLDGEVTDYLTIDMRAVVRGTIIGGQYANQLALAALQAQVPSGYRLDPVTLEFVVGDVLEVSDDLAVSFNVLATGEAVADLETRDVANMIRGMPLEEAQDLLQKRFPVSDVPQITVDPEWLGRLPWLPLRIDVQILDARG
jgi:hypothetical protein